MSVSPLTINMLIHHHVRVDPWPNSDAPACIEVTKWLHENDLIDQPADVANLTPRGAAWLEQILSTPFPVETWVDPRFTNAVSGNPTPDIREDRT